MLLNDEMDSEAKRKITKKALEQRRASIEVALRKKRECERKGLEIVEHLIENQINLNWLIENSRFINPQYYNDVIDERSLSKMCGLPFCGNQLANNQIKKFSISTKTNKVYDISERKKFCSDKSFAISNNIRGQLSTTPLWMRDDEELSKIEIPLALKGLPGEEVHITSVTLPDDDNQNELATTTEKKLKNSSHVNKMSDTKFHPHDFVYRSLKIWFCLKTFDWLFDVNEEPEDELKEINIKMKKLEVNKTLLKKDDPFVDFKPAVGFEALKKDERFRQLKVRSFYSGRWEYACEENEEEKDRNDGQNSGENVEQVEVPIVLPLANVSAQRASRRKVVLNYLEKWFADLSTSTSLKFRSYQRDLHDLIATFNLTADTVTFCPEETPLLGTLILLTLSRKNAIVKNKLMDSDVQKQLCRVLQSYNCTLSDLEDFLNGVIEKIRRQQNTSDCL